MWSRTSATNARQAGAVVSPSQAIRSAVWISSNMIGRSHCSIITGISADFRSPRVASALTHFDLTEREDQSTTTALAA
jgi:hypothetical protein